MSRVSAPQGLCRGRIVSPSHHRPEAGEAAVLYHGKQMRRKMNSAGPSEVILNKALDSKSRIVTPLVSQLSWTHFTLLIKLPSDESRSFYIHRTLENRRITFSLRNTGRICPLKSCWRRSCTMPSSKFVSGWGNAGSWRTEGGTPGASTVHERLYRSNRGLRVRQSVKIRRCPAHRPRNASCRLRCALSRIGG